MKQEILKIKSYWLDKEEGCDHIWGAWENAIEGGGLFWNKDELVKDAQNMQQESFEPDGLFHLGDLKTMFRYCPICGKKLILSENGNEVELIDK